MNPLLAPILMLMPMLAAAQTLDRGFVYFANTETTLITFATDETIPVPLRGERAGVADGPPLSAWHVALEWFDSDNSRWESLLPIAAMIKPGRFVGGTRYHYWRRELQSFRVQVWSGSYATMDEALASKDTHNYAGMSDTFTINSGFGMGPAIPITWGSTGFTGMCVYQIPEVSVSVLAVFGSIIVLPRLLRRSQTSASIMG